MVKFLVALTSVLFLAGVGSVSAQTPAEIVITHKDQTFSPAQIELPANTAVTFRVKNEDAKSIEFESSAMHVEKVIPAKGEAVIKVRPLKAGKYEFENEFHDATRGTVIVK